MKKYRRKTMANPQSTYYKKRITKNRRRAKNVGLLYLLGILAFAAVACLPLCTNSLANVGVLEFYKTFTSANLKNWKDATVFVQLACSGLYALMLLGVVINVLRSLGKLGWLHKKKASKKYGFNRNVFAMNDLGKIFSGSFAVIVATYFLISVLCGAFAPNMLMYIVLGVGAALRVFAGVWGAKVAYFDVHEGQLSEEKRKVGRFAPFFRNLLQLATVFGVIFFFVKATTLDTVLPTLVQKNGISELTKNTDNLISVALQAVAVLCSFVLIKHATAITEYNADGAHGAGMKNFRVFALFTALATGGVVAVQYFMGDKTLNKNMAIVAGIAFVMFLLEVMMRKCPKHPDDKKAKKSKTPNEDELTFDSLTFAPVEKPLTKKEKKAQKKAAKQANSANAVATQPAPVFPPMPATANRVAAPMPMPMPAPMPMTNASAQDAKANTQFIPYPIPQPYPVYQQVPVPYHVPAPAPATTPIVVTTAPAVAPTPAKVEEKEVEKDVTEGMTKVENEKAELACPHCGARLRVDGAAEYHRCPACRKVFQLRKVEKKK